MMLFNEDNGLKLERKEVPPPFLFPYKSLLGSVTTDPPHGPSGNGGSRGRAMSTTLVR